MFLPNYSTNFPEVNPLRSLLREDMNLSPSARTLWEIQERMSRLPVETSTNIYTSVLRSLQDALQKSDARRAQVCDEPSLRRYQQEARSLFLDCLGGLPETSAGSASRLMGRMDCGAFILEKVLLQPRPETWASCNVYVPANGSGPFPAALMTVGHDDRGKADPEYQYVAQLLASAGILTLVLDPYGQGERFEHFELDLDFQPIQGCSGEHDLTDWKCKLLGQSLARYFVQDGICALDYLAARPDVDASRIGITGHSGGGTQCTMLMLAAGDRLACAAPCAYVTDHQAMMDTGIDPDNEMLWPGSLAAGLDYVDFVAGVAPRPVLLLTNQHDFFPREGTLRTLEKARALWQRVGGDPLPDMATATSQHAYPHTLGQAAAQFFLRHLKGVKTDVPTLLENFVFKPLDPADTWCTPEGQLLKYDPAMRTIHDELKDEMLRLRADRGVLTTAALIPWLEESLHLRELDAAPQCRVFAEGICGHYQYRCVIWRPQSGYWNSGVFLRDLRQGDKPLPTLIALWPEGTRRIAEHSRWIHRAVQSGYQVLVMDVAGSGALLPAQLGNTSMYVGWSTMYNLNAYLMQTGDCFLALRTRQAIAAVRMLRGWAEADASRLCFCGWGEFARYAEIAALMTDTPVCSDGDYDAWEDMVAERYHDQTCTHEWVFPGALRHFDMPQLRALLHQRDLESPDLFFRQDS